MTTRERFNALVDSVRADRMTYRAFRQAIDADAELTAYYAEIDERSREHHDDDPRGD